MPNTYRIRTSSGTHFTGAAITGVALVEDLDLKAATVTGAGQGLAAGGIMRAKVKEIRIFSTQNLAWELEFYRKTNSSGAVAIDTDALAGKFAFAAVDGSKANGDTNFKYWVPGLDVSYEDGDMTGKLHLRLINRDAVAKIAGAGGEVVVEVTLEPTNGL